MPGATDSRHDLQAMAIEYQIEGGVLLLRGVTLGHAFLRDALASARAHPESRPGMPLLLDLRGDPTNAHYEDIRWRLHILEEMRQQLGPRWAVLTGPGPGGEGVSRMVAAFSEAGGLDVRIFGEKDEALRWLTEEQAPSLRRALS